MSIGVSCADVHVDPSDTACAPLLKCPGSATQFGVFLDELAAGLHLVAHEDGEDLVGGRWRPPCVTRSMMRRLGVHGGLPQLLRRSSRPGPCSAGCWVRRRGRSRCRSCVQLDRRRRRSCSFLLLRDLVTAAAGRCRRSRCSMSGRMIAVEEGQKQGADMGCRPRRHRSCRRCGGSAAWRCRNSSPMPAPKAVIMALISALPSILSRRVFSTLRILPRRGRMAWKLPVPAALGGAAGGVALDDEDLALGRVAAPSSRPACRAGTWIPARVLRRVSSRALRAASRARAAVQAFVQDDARPSAGFSSRKVGKPVVDHARPPAARISLLPSLVLVWPSNWGSSSLTRDDGRQALAHVLAGEVGVAVLEDACILRA